MKFFNKIATKRDKIENAKSTVFATIVIASVIVSVCIVLLNFFIKEINFNNKLLGEKRKANQTLENNLEASDTLAKEFLVLETGEVGARTILDALPSKYDFPALVSSAEFLVERSGLVMTAFNGIDEEDSAEQESYSTIPKEMLFAVEVRGGYSDIKEFVRNLEKTIRPMKITNMEMSGSDTNITLKIDVTTYYQPASNLNYPKEVLQ